MIVSINVFVGTVFYFGKKQIVLPPEQLNNLTKPNLTFFKQTYLLQVFSDTFRHVFVDLVPTPNPWHQLRNDLKKERKKVHSLFPEMTPLSK
jgi:hypothetical protein